ncbi:CBS domain-containing protein [Nocardiopsis potens]|uniref:CBS domain-containing protein n=1 Tax=Nocardiopsis potens TaxID=1246458 RepID=UPI000344C834|nr:CBS domain-containing protein [Nocardiopsis potens]
MTVRVEDLMAADPVGVSADTDPRELAELLRRFGVSAVPVVDGEGRVIGMVSEADLLLRLTAPGGPGPGRGRRAREERSKAGAATVRRMMTAPPVTVGPEEPVARAAELMHRHRVKHLPVVGPDGALVGVIGRSDLVGLYTRPDDRIREEVVRRLLTEFDLPRVRVRVERGEVVLEGRVRLRSSAVALSRSVRHIEGVVHVADRLDWDADDLSPLSSALMPGPRSGRER